MARKRASDQQGIHGLDQQRWVAAAAAAAHRIGRHRHDVDVEAVVEAVVEITTTPK